MAERQQEEEKEQQTTAKMNNEQLLESIYYDPTTGYTGVNSLLAELGRKVKRSVVTEWLSKQDTYTLHRPAVEKFKRNQTLSKGIDYVWQSDLVDIQPLGRWNDGFRYLLVVIDTFSRYAWVQPLKNKTGQEVVRGLDLIIKESGRKPQKLCTDMGKEYLNKDVKQFLFNKKIIQYSVASDMKAAIAERFNRTLKERMWRYFTRSGTKRYIDILQQLVTGYNNRMHRVIGLPPSKVNEKNEKRLWQKQFGDSSNLRKRKKPKFKIGQKVRLSSKKGIFDKGYTGKWTRELFTIGKVLTNQKQPMYEIIDPIDNNPIKGGFYEKQIQLVDTEER